MLAPFLTLGQRTNLVEQQPYHLPEKIFKDITGRTEKLDHRLTSKTLTYLKRFSRKEEKLRKKIYKLDSNVAKRLFSRKDEKFKEWKQHILEDGAGGEAVTGEYLNNVDSLKGSLSFIKENSQLFNSSQLAECSQAALDQIRKLQSRFQTAEQIKQFINQRKEDVKSALSQYSHLPKSVLRPYNDLSKEIYYYSQQVNEYKEIFNTPGQFERRVLSVIGELPAFRQFMREHGALAGLFSVPANYGSPQGLRGLQTQSQVRQLIQNQIASGGPGAGQVLAQNLQAAQAQLNQFKDKINRLGGGSGDMDMPDFRPNGQRTKPLLKRLEYGCNLQTTRANSFFPSTSDLALSLGYKLNDKSTAGIGASYKLGWGKDIRHIALSNEGIGFRSFLDVKIKGSFFASAGFEYNYQRPFSSLVHLYQLDDWQQSGLVGISKIVSAKNKLFKKTKLQLLWDFLSYRQRPSSQAIKFRVGYAF